jgi:hypothetical protein
LEGIGAEPDDDIESGVDDLDRHSGDGSMDLDLERLAISAGGLQVISISTSDNMRLNELDEATVYFPHVWATIGIRRALWLEWRYS